MEKKTKEMGFLSSDERMREERTHRYSMIKNPIKTGIKYLDDMFVGITHHDLVLIGAKTGVGKTELVNIIATNNAQAGKKVYVFALEASPNELERRSRYRVLSKAYKKAYPGRFVTYRDFIWGRYPKEFQELDEEFENLKDDSYFKNLHTFYRTKNFTIADLEKIFAVIESKADLVILDHIHFFDFESENENKELGDITKRIRDLVLISGVPVILVGHLKKPSEQSKKFMPDLYDFHGSSNLPKQITKGVIFESGGIHEGKFITMMRVVKDREYGAATKYVGKVLFDPETNEYENGYKLCVLEDRETKIKELNENEGEYPKWLKNF